MEAREHIFRLGSPDLRHRHRHFLCGAKKRQEDGVKESLSRLLWPDLFFFLSRPVNSHCGHPNLRQVVQPAHRTRFSTRRRTSPVEQGGFTTSLRFCGSRFLKEGTFKSVL